MPDLMQTVPTAHPPVPVRLVLESFDSGEECSFQHWMNVWQLVDEGDDETELIDTQLMPEPEPTAWN
jgi:hypothetical protein